MSDLFAKCAAWKEVQVVKVAGHYPYYRVIEQNDGTEVVIRGKRVIMACSNNYLGLAQDPRLREAAAEAARRWGSSTCGSRLLNGTLTLHDELDHRLARFFGREAAVSFPTGFQANVGTLSALVHRHDLVFADRMVHASLVEGIHASYGEARRFGHNNLAQLEAQLSAAPRDAGRLVVVDGVYSMEGDLADLPGITRLTRRYGARLMVDEAHGLGVLGAGGRGASEHFGVEREVDLVMATFSKSLASIGGVVAGPAEVINWIRHKARALVFSASMTPAAAAAALKALEILEQEPERRARLWDVSERVHRELRGMGFDTRPSVTPVVPIAIGDQLTSFRFWRKLTDEGLFVSPVTRPAVEKDLVRAVFMATHSDAQIDRALEIFERCGRALGLLSHERPHGRVLVKIARPGSTGFRSSAEDAPPVEVGRGGRTLLLRDVLTRRNGPLLARLSDAAELVTWRALNADAGAARRLRSLPRRIWRQRRRVQGRLLSLGMAWLARRAGGEAR